MDTSTKQKTASKRALTPKECEVIYGLNVGTLANMRVKKVGPRYIKLGKKVLYLAEDIEGLMAEHIVLTRDQRCSR